MALLTKNVTKCHALQTDVSSTTISTLREYHIVVMGLSSKHIFGVFRAQGTCLVATNVVLPARGS